MVLWKGGYWLFLFPVSELASKWSLLIKGADQKCACRAPFSAGEGDLSVDHGPASLLLGGPFWDAAALSVPLHISGCPRVSLSRTSRTLAVSGLQCHQCTHIHSSLVVPSSSHRLSRTSRNFMIANTTNVPDLSSNQILNIRVHTHISLHLKPAPSQSSHIRKRCHHVPVASEKTQVHCLGFLSPPFPHCTHQQVLRPPSVKYTYPPPVSTQSRSHLSSGHQEQLGVPHSCPNTILLVQPKWFLTHALRHLFKALKWPPLYLTTCEHHPFPTCSSPSAHEPYLLCSRHTSFLCFKVQHAHWALACHML